MRILAEIRLPPSQRRDDAVNLATLLPGFTSASLAALRNAYGEGNDPTSPRVMISKRLTCVADLDALAVRSVHVQIEAQAERVSVLDSAGRGSRGVAAESEKQNA